MTMAATGSPGAGGGVVGMEVCLLGPLQQPTEVEDAAALEREADADPEDLAYIAVRGGMMRMMRRGRRTTMWRIRRWRRGGGGGGW
jgi:hypothetical protein